MVTESQVKSSESAFIRVLISFSPHPYSPVAPSVCQFVLKPLPIPHLLYARPSTYAHYPCCLRYAMISLMLDSFLAPPFCAHVARSSAASLPSCPECPFTFTHRVTTRLSVTACSSRRHKPSQHELTRGGRGGLLCPCHATLLTWLVRHHAVHAY